MQLLIGALRVRTFGAITLALLVSVGAGCVQTSMPPARQIDRGDVALSASIDEPGTVYIPRASGQFTYGLGGGDLTLNLGGTIGSFGGGVMGRSYLTDVINAEAQAQVAKVWEARQWFLTAGVQGVPSEQNPLYAGGHLGILRGTAPLEDLSGLSSLEDPPHTIPVVGASLGYGRIDLGRGWSMQLELEANAPIPPTKDEDRPLPPSRLSVGFFRHFN